MNIADSLNQITFETKSVERMDGRTDHYVIADSMEVTIESDGTWFREQEEWRRSDGAKLPNKEAKKLLSRFIEAEKRA